MEEEQEDDLETQMGFMELPTGMGSPGPGKKKTNKVLSPSKRYQEGGKMVLKENVPLESFGTFEFQTSEVLDERDFMTLHKSDEESSLEKRDEEFDTGVSDNDMKDLEALFNVEIREKPPGPCLNNKDIGVTLENPENPDFKDTSEFVLCGARAAFTEPAPDDEDTEISCENVMEKFMNMCCEYTAMAKNMEGVRCAAKGKFSEAVNSFSKASELGYAKAQYNLGLCYETGKGVASNISQAVRLYSAAEKENHPMAMFNLAVCHLTGEGVSLDEEKALHLMERAAEGGLAKAQTYLGEYHTREPCMDKEKAVYYLKEAAKQNDPKAQYYLGVCFEKGWGLEQDMREAASLYTKADAGGDEDATYRLAFFFEHGLGGLPKYEATAEDLYDRCKADGNAENHQEQ